MTGHTKWEDVKKEKKALQSVLPDIKAAGRTVAYKWPTITTAEDMTHDLVLHFIERKGSLEKLSEMEPGERRASLIRVGHQLAAALRDDFEVFSGQYRYSVDDVKEGLRKGALKGKDSFNVQSGDVVQALVALNKKNPQQAQAVVSRYLHSRKPDNEQARSVLRRAEDNLTRLMNRGEISEEYDHRNGGRTRPHVNNAESIGVGEFHYEGFTEDDSYLSDLETDRGGWDE
jgi:hypothetical protein